MLTPYHWGYGLPQHEDGSANLMRGFFNLMRKEDCWNKSFTKILSFFIIFVKKSKLTSHIKWRVSACVKINSKFLSFLQNKFESRCWEQFEECNYSDKICLCQERMCNYDYWFFRLQQSHKYYLRICNVRWRWCHQSLKYDFDDWYFSVFFSSASGNQKYTL